MTDEELNVYKKELEMYELKARENMAYTQSKVVKRYVEDISNIDLGDDIPDRKDVANLSLQLQNCALYVRQLSEALDEIRKLKDKLNEDLE